MCLAEGSRGGSMNLLRRIWDWMAGQFVREVPENTALCEFDCRKPQCWEGEWETCKRRLRRAAGELMPAKEPTPEVVADSTPESEVIYHDSDWL
jgi:hypothetical protein